MKYGSDEGKLLVCCLHPYLSCLKKKKNSFSNIALCSPWLMLDFHSCQYIYYKRRRIFKLVSFQIFRVNLKNTQSPARMECVLCVLTLLMRLIALIKLKYCS